MEELVKDLRENHDKYFARDMQAADAIEKLQKVGNTLLAKYEEEATTVIWEYSGNIDESLDCLRKEVGKYKAQIDGEEE